jgi:hypothetical protein
MLVASGQIGESATLLRNALVGVRAWVASSMSAVSTRWTDQPHGIASVVTSFVESVQPIPGNDPAVTRTLLVSGTAYVQRTDAGLQAQHIDEVTTALIVGALVFDACSPGIATGVHVQLNGPLALGPTGENRSDLALRIPWRFRITLRIADDTEELST